MMTLNSSYRSSILGDALVKLSHAAGACLAATTIMAIVGCAGLGAPAGTNSIVSTHQALHGSVHGGQQPISGSTIQLYAVGTSGTGSASTPLLTQTVTTDANGGFSLTGLYACPQYGSLVYATAMGGNPGLGSGKSNSAIGLLGVIGPCNYPALDGSGNLIYTLDPTSFLALNEVTTVAGVYAAAAFMSDASHIGSGSNTVGITNAFTTAAMLADISTGTTPGPQLPATVTYDPSTGFPVVIATLANIIAGCINTDGSGNGCNQLFANTTNLAHNDTVSAALAIAKTPGNHVGDLFDLVQTFAPFSPSLSAAPNDWTVAMHYTNAQLGSPNGIAFDSYGNVWVANQSSSSVTEVFSGVSGNTAGLYNFFQPSGLLGAQALAIDQSNNIWIANTAGNSIVELDQYGNSLSGAGFTSGGINAPVAIAIDKNGFAWIANANGNSITQLYADGTPSGASPITVGYNSYAVSQPTGIAVDANSRVWVGNSGLQTAYGLASQILSFDQYGSPLTFTSQTVQNPLGLAIDASNNVWVASNGTSQVSSITSSNGTMHFASGGGLSQPAAVAIDSAGMVWTSNNAGSGSVSQISGAGVVLSPSTGFGSLSSPLGIAIDPSGSLWTANAGDNSLTEFVGLAAPTTTPVISKVQGMVKIPKPGSRIANQH